ncbi:MAG: hypothetical protein SGJ18_14330 [Pseudomonadota bacterium]|nr:hypothetical protein [Pseudomonadota bacterium]
MTNLETYLTTKDNARNTAWEHAFLTEFCKGHVELLVDTPQPGPEGFPYLFVKTSGRATESVSKIIDWLSNRGIGMVVNPQKGLPDYVFTYGMVWGLKEKNTVLPKLETLKSSQFELQKDRPFSYGEPSLEFFPHYARKILREFFNHQGILAPRMLMISSDNKSFDLCFSIESLGNPPKSEHKGIVEAIGWFFPFNTSIVVLEEKGLPKFIAL